jgi:hypothetical protein
MPDKDNAGHSLPFEKMPLFDKNGVRRTPDDMQPPANLRRMFKDGNINLGDEQCIDDFSNQFCVDKHLVIAYFHHLQSLKNGQIIRSNQREKAKTRKSSKKFEDYRWTELIMEGKLDSLNVYELDKYLHNFKLKKIGKKGDKIKTIMYHDLRHNEKLVIEKIRAKLRPQCEETEIACL